MNKYNDNQMSKDRIYVRDIFLIYSFNPNNKDTYGEGIHKFIVDAGLKALTKNIVGWQIEPWYDDRRGEEDGRESFQLAAVGHRLESDFEYKNRLKWRITQMESSFDAWNRRREYYESVEGYTDQVKELKAIVDTLLPNNP